jgi:hypothetical protein
MGKGRWLAILSLLAACCAFASVATAASPHFTRGGTPKCTDTGTTLVCSGELVGLGNKDLVISLDSSAVATFLCGAPGNANPAPG